MGAREADPDWGVATFVPSGRPPLDLGDLEPTPEEMARVTPEEIEAFKREVAETMKREADEQMSPWPTTPSGPTPKAT